MSDEIIEGASSYSYLARHINKTKSRIVTLERKKKHIDSQIESLKGKMVMMKKMRDEFKKAHTEYKKRSKPDADGYQ